MTKNVMLKGITVGTHDDQKDMIAAIEANGILPIIDSVFGLDQIAIAFARQISQKHFGKICVEF
jgi:NADPH:quinone reductase-like Zn-dependent oxidoreductase